MSTDTKNSYSQIFKSSSIIGGAQSIEFLVGMMRTKLVAVLLGPSGVGLIGLYMSATGLVGTLSGLGIGSSGVRSIAEAHASGDLSRKARTVKTLRRACWITGIIGWLLTAILSKPLSLWTFGSADRAGMIALLGVTILVGAIAGGETALLQGERRIGDLARLSVFSVVTATLVALALYAWIGEAGIVPVLIVTGVFNLSFACCLARRVDLPDEHLDWADTWTNAKGFMSLGIAFMWGGLLTSAVALFTRSLIVRELGLDANGIYQAAWGISGLFAGFVLTAMGADFYPRLTSIAHDHRSVNRLVNEQTEVGILLALPGLLGTLGLAPMLMRVFYTPKFVLGAELLPMIVLGVFGRVVSWPLGFIQLAKGASRLFVLTETFAHATHLGLIVLLLRHLGLYGVSLAYALLYCIYTVMMLSVAGRLTSFRWSQSVLRLLSVSAALICLGFAVQRFLPRLPGAAVGLGLTLISGLFSLRGVATRLGHENKLVNAAARIPGIAALCRIENVGMSR